MSDRLRVGMEIIIFVNSGKDILRFKGKIIFVDDKFLEVMDEKTRQPEIINISHIVNIKINQEIERYDKFKTNS